MPVTDQYLHDQLPYVRSLIKYLSTHRDSITYYNIITGMTLQSGRQILAPESGILTTQNPSDNSQKLHTNSYNNENIITCLYMMILQCKHNGNHSAASKSKSINVFLIQKHNATMRKLSD